MFTFVDFVQNFLRRAGPVAIIRRSQKRSPEDTP